jgi:ribosome modulation factor
MSNYSKRRRHAIVRAVREDGRAAARAGRHRDTCPHDRLSMDRYQWLQGHDAEMELMVRTAVQHSSDCVEAWWTRGAGCSCGFRDVSRLNLAAQ